VHLADYNVDNVIWDLTCDFAEETEEIYFQVDVATATAPLRECGMKGNAMTGPVSGGTFYKPESKKSLKQNLAGLQQKGSGDTRGVARLV
jgi:hypothetical protein